MSGPLPVLAPPQLAGPLQRAVAGVADVHAWDGARDSPPPVDDALVWVPPYGVGQRREWIGRVLAALPHLQVVQLLSAGVEPWTDLVPAPLTLCAGRGIHGGSTAELAVALVLAAVRDLPTYVEQQARGAWVRHDPDTVADRTVLVLGAGDIGGRVAAVLRLLEARVWVAARRPREGVLTLDEAWQRLPEVDVLVVALPATPETVGVVDEAVLARLPDGALVVNVARGTVVDGEALTREVVASRLRAALDVTDPEPLPADHPLWSAPGAIVTPHVGGGAAGWEGRAVTLVADQLERLRDGRALRHVVTHGY